ncbi:extensin family protein [Kalamiella sp. sgz302252]|uniref:extensin-like domain-containing protein n=1 Tax=Pantoea sp. sgz302252 TaxID=3341827 RepID=UPI0036D32A63
MKVLIGLGGMLLLALLIAPWLQKTLPSAWNPFAPLNVTDAPGWITRYKLKRLQADPDACMAALQRAREGGYIRFSRVGSVEGNCPLAGPVRVQGFGEVSLSSSFLASCPLALSTTLFIAQDAKPLAAAELGSPLVRVDHVGSYACRNIYHRAKGRLSEHATADALDVTGFRLKDGRQITVQKAWQQRPESHWLRQVFQRSCAWYGNSLGPDYNRAHATHFHLGMRGFGVCR